MTTYSFLTKNHSRIDVMASTPISAYNKLRSIPCFSDQVQPLFIQYNKDGFCFNMTWSSVREG